jgi:hypothetical protein
VWEVRFALRWMLRPGASWGGSLSLGPLIFAKPLAHQRLALPMDDGPYGPGKHPPAEVRDELLLADPDSWWAWAVIVNGSSGQGLSSSVRMQLGQPSSEGLLAFSTDPLACPLAVHVTAVRWSAWQRMLNASYSLYGPLVLPHPPLDFEDCLWRSSSGSQFLLIDFWERGPFFRSACHAHTLEICGILAFKL